MEPSRITSHPDKSEASKHATQDHREDLEDTNHALDNQRVAHYDTLSQQMSLDSKKSMDMTEYATGKQTPDPFLFPQEERVPDHINELEQIPTHRSPAHMGDALENLAHTMTGRARLHESHELQPTISRRSRTGTTLRRLSSTPVPAGLPDEAGSPVKPITQGVPPELRNFASEIVFVLVCSSGQLLFSWFLGDVNVNQSRFKEVLGIKNTQLPWLIGSFNIANGLSVVLSGSLTDLMSPKSLVVGAFAWLTAWNVIGAFSLTPSRSPLFFVVRAMQGLAVGVLVSGSMSILGRTYSPGLRKTRGTYWDLEYFYSITDLGCLVFSCMATMAPFGFWLGAMQGGALSAHLAWIFGSNAILCGALCIAAFFTIPTLRPAPDIPGAEVPSFRHFDYLGALCATFGCVCLLFGLTQGSAASWAPIPTRYSSLVSCS